MKQLIGYFEHQTEYQMFTQAFKGGSFELKN